MDFQGLGHDARGDEVVKSLVDQKCHTDCNDRKNQRGESEGVGSLKVSDQAKNNPVNRWAYVGKKTGKSGYQCHCNRVMDPEDGHQDCVSDHLREEYYDLPTEKSVPDIPQLLAQAVDIFGIAGDVKIKDAFPQPSALQKKEIRNDHYEGCPAQCRCCTSCQGPHQPAHFPQGRFDIG